LPLRRRYRRPRAACRIPTRGTHVRPAGPF